MTGYQALACVVCAHGQQFGRNAMTFGIALGQRLANRHPAGTFTGDGISP